VPLCLRGSSHDGVVVLHTVISHHACALLGRTVADALIWFKDGAKFFDLFANGAVCPKSALAQKLHKRRGFCKQPKFHGEPQ
jgi:hypothetical protein